MNLFCFPLAAKPSNSFTSSSVSLTFALSAPSKLEVIRAGVTDLGRMTMSLARRYPRSTSAGWTSCLAAIAVTVESVRRGDPVEPRGE
jgi:hypothetical protein